MKTIAYKHPNMRRERDPILTEIMARRGMQKFLANELGLTVQSVSAWKHVPEHHVKAVSRLLGIPQYKLLAQLREEAGRVQG